MTDVDHDALFVRLDLRALSAAVLPAVIAVRGNEFVQVVFQTGWG